MKNLKFIALIVCVILVMTSCFGTKEDNGTKEKEKEKEITTLSSTNDKSTTEDKVGSKLGTNFERGLKVVIGTDRFNLYENVNLDIKSSTFEDNTLTSSIGEGLHQSVTVVINDNASIIIENLIEDFSNQFEKVDEFDNFVIYKNGSRVIAYFTFKEDTYVLEGKPYEDGWEKFSETLDYDVFIESIKVVAQNIEDNQDLTDIPSIYDYLEEMSVGGRKININLVKGVSMYRSVYVDISGFKQNIPYILYMENNDKLEGNIEELEIPVLGLKAYTKADETRMRQIFLEDGENIYEMLSNPVAEIPTLDVIEYFFGS